MFLLFMYFMIVTPLLSSFLCMQLQKERAKVLSMFGTLVSPKLRASQLTFETGEFRKLFVENYRTPSITISVLVHHFSWLVLKRSNCFLCCAALETLVEIANARSSILKSYEVLHRDMKSTKEWQVIGVQQSKIK